MPSFLNLGHVMLLSYASISEVKPLPTLYHAIFSSYSPHDPMTRCVLTITSLPASRAPRRHGRFRTQERTRFTPVFDSLGIERHAWSGGVGYCYYRAVRAFL
jgi:hypothetical protein